MKLVVLYRPNSEHGTKTEQFVRDFSRQYGRSSTNIKMLHIDGREGDQLARTYDITSYPAFLAIREDNGSPKQVWQGEQLPLMSEVAAALQ